jgi:hypothetical protein
VWTNARMRPRRAGSFARGRSPSRRCSRYPHVPAFERKGSDLGPSASAPAVCRFAPHWLLSSMPSTKQPSKSGLELGLDADPQLSAKDIQMAYKRLALIWYSRAPPSLFRRPRAIAYCAAHTSSRQNADASMAIDRKWRSWRNC